MTSADTFLKRPTLQNAIYAMDQFKLLIGAFRSNPYEFMSSEESMLEFKTLYEIIGLYSSNVKHIFDQQKGVKNVTNRNAFNDDIRGHIKNYSDTLETLFAFLNRILPSNNANTISIRLTNVKDLGDLAKSAQNLHTAISQLVSNSTIDGEDTLSSVNDGSVVLNVFVKSAAAISLIGATVWSAAFIYQKTQEARIIEQRAESIKIKNESLIDLKEGLDRDLKILIEAEAQSINEKFFKQDSLDQAQYNDQLSRIRHSIVLFSNEIEKGATIAPSLEQPEDVNNLFPDWSNLPLIESKIPKLPAGESDK